MEMYNKNMGSSMIVFGTFFWFVMSLGKYFYLKVESENSIPLWRAIKITFRNKGLECVLSIMQTLSLFWILIGVIFAISRVSQFIRVNNNVIFIVVYVLPVWVIAAIVSKKKTK
jgi:hypothetical protein